jgi:RecJ-like exonuclease
MMRNYQGFENRAKECKEAVLEMKDPLVVNHYDCDGLSAGAIAIKFLEDNKIKHRIKTIRKLDDVLIEQLKDEKEIIFCDLGGAHPKVDSLNAKVVIFDHHQTTGTQKLQLNPHLFGFDGSTEMSGSTCTYWALQKLPEVAIVGAVGDMQYPFIGLNLELAKKLEQQSILKIEFGLKMYGRMSRPLVQFLAYADEPYLPGLGGDEARCAMFLEANKIYKNKDAWPTYTQLSDAQKKKLIGAIATYLAENYGGKYNAQNLVGEIYSFPRFLDKPELYDAGEFSTMLNACGRHGQEQIGIDICLQKQGALQKGRELLLAHKKALREGVEYAYRNTRDFGPLLVLDGRGVIDDGIIGVVAGMMYGGARKKAIIGLSNDERENIKISARGTKTLVDSGLNLGLALKEACAHVEGQGGGHHIAAGATIPQHKLDDFLKIFVEIIQRQIAIEDKH